MSNKKAISVLLAKLSDLVADLSDDDWSAVEQGRFDLRIEMRGRREPTSPGTATTADIEALLRSLDAFGTREEADALLSAEGIRKEDLLAIAKNLEVSVTRKDSNELIRQKIVENTVGFRIRSRSVQGSDPGRGD